MKRRVISVLAVLLLILPLTALTASADAGLKKNLSVKVEGLSSPCYVTVLYAMESWQHDRPYESDEERRELFGSLLSDDAENLTGEELAAKKKETDTAYRRIKEYKDPDGYLFVGQAAYLMQDGSFEKYSPPDHFKILLYCPASDTLSVSDKLAAPNLFTQAKVMVENDRIVSASYSAVSKSPAFLEDFVLLLNSLIVTIVIELLIALCFLFTKGKQIRTVILTNLVSLPMLNLLLLIFNPPIYGSLFSFPYALFEIAVTAAEAAVYLHFLPKYSKGKPCPKWRIITYAIVANLATYAFAALVPSYYLLAPLMLIPF